MKVVCIDDTGQHTDDQPIVKKGNIYLVIDSLTDADADLRVGYIPCKGVYYVLAETGNEVAFHESLFIKINEQEIDETELTNYSIKENVYAD